MIFGFLDFLIIFFPIVSIFRCTVSMEPMEICQCQLIQRARGYKHQN